MFGLGLGYFVYYMMWIIDDYEVEVLVIFVMVMGGYLLVSVLYFFGLLAMVVVGLMVGYEWFWMFFMLE